MNAEVLRRRLREVVWTELPLPGEGATPQRHRALLEIAREDVSLAKLAEAHWDAIAILAEGGDAPRPDSCMVSGHPRFPVASCC